MKIIYFSNTCLNSTGELQWNHAEAQQSIKPVIMVRFKELIQPNYFNQQTKVSEKHAALRKK